METINWAPFVSLAIQIPLVGAFMWFVLIMQDRNAKALAEREKDWREFMKQQRSDHISHEVAMQDKWREFLAQEDKENKEVLDRLTNKIETMANTLTASNALIMAHDITTRELLAGVKERSNPRKESPNDS